MQIAVRRADAARLCRQRRDRQHLGLRAHADAARFAEKSFADGEEADGRQPAAGVRARRRRCHHPRPAPRRPENHRRCRLRARAHEITARFGAGFTTLLEQALGQGDAPISPRKPLPDYIVEKRFPEPVATEAVISATLSRWPGCWSRRWTGRARARGGWKPSFFRTDGAVRAIAVDTGQPVTKAEVIDRLFRERLDALAAIRSIPVSASISFACPPAAPKSWCSSSAISTPMCTTMTNWPP